MESSNAYCRRATSAIVEQVAATSPAVSGRISCSSYSSSLPPRPTTLTGPDSLLLLLRAGGKTSAVVKKCRLPRVYTTTGPVPVPADGEAWAATRDRGDGHSWSQSAEPEWAKITHRA